MTRLVLRKTNNKQTTKTAYPKAVQKYEMNGEKYQQGEGE
jgi:hypothetical protein